MDAAEKTRSADNVHLCGKGAEAVDIRIIVAAHKPCRMPEDSMYLPVQVGAAGKEQIGFQPDDEGENISEKNANYCELTGLFWAWKHLSADYIGLVHYRRHFAGKKRCPDKWKRIISQSELEAELQKAPVLLPKPRHYWIESNYSQYVHSHHAADLDVTRTILQEKYPAYVRAFDTVMRRTYGHRFNMFVMERSYADRWCAWIFDVLHELELRLDISGYSPYDARVFGFVAERLLDVWLMTNRVSWRDLPYVFTEQQNWPLKVWRFLLRKFRRNQK